MTGTGAPRRGSPAPGARVLRVAVDLEPRRGVDNMAIDDALLARMEAAAAGAEGEEAWVRLYGWVAPTLSLGFAQPLSRGVDLAYCRGHGIDVVRRVTGGRSVLHDREHTYAVAIPYSFVPGVAASLAACHALVSQVLLEALGSLGVDAARGCGTRPGGGRQACFASVSRDEITVAGRKLVGSAQRRGRLGFLQHGSILVAADVARHLAATGEDAADGGWIGLGDLLHHPPDREAMGRVLVERLAAALGARPLPGDAAAPGPALDEARAKHGSDAWVGRVP